MVIHESGIGIPKGVAEPVGRSDGGGHTFGDRQAPARLRPGEGLTLPHEGVPLRAKAIQSLRHIGHEAFRKERDPGDALAHLPIEVGDLPLEGSRVGGRALLPLGLDEPLELRLYRPESRRRE